MSNPTTLSLFSARSNPAQDVFQLKDAEDNVIFNVGPEGQIPGGIPSGSNQEVQYNDNGEFAGAAGLLTNGSHVAIGVGAQVDNAPTSGLNNQIDHPLSPIVNVTVQSTTTDPSLPGGTFTGVTFNPSSSPTSAFGYGSYIVAALEGDNWSGSTEGITGNIIQVGNYSTGTVPGIAGGYDESFHLSTGTLEEGIGNFCTVANRGGGTIDLAIAGWHNVGNDNNSIINHAISGQFDFSVDDSSSCSVTAWDAILIPTPSVGDNGTIGTAIGLHIQEMGVDNVTTPYQIYSEGAAPSYFAGPISAQMVSPTTVYSASGTALPPPSSSLQGARAVVSDATSPTWMGTYTSGGNVTCPVFCNGTSWLTA